MQKSIFRVTEKTSFTKKMINSKQEKPLYSKPFLPYNKIRFIYVFMNASLEQSSWIILLYYKYVFIENPEKFAYDHLKLCKSLGLKGRILIAEEGINGTVGGPKTQTDEYIRIMKEDPRFTD